MRGCSYLLSQSRGVSVTDYSFIGHYRHQIDAKSRLAIPASYRTFLRTPEGEDLVLTQHVFDRCLLAFPVELHRRIVTKLDDRRIYDPRAGRLRRLLISDAFPCQLDRSGRVLIPRLLVEYAGLSGMAVVSGVGKNFEIWSAERWEERRGHDAKWVAEENLGQMMEEFDI
jgi:MraZ protein